MSYINRLYFFSTSNWHNSIINKCVDLNNNTNKLNTASLLFITIELYALIYQEKERENILKNKENIEYDRDGG
jgi:hypothetical protein